MNDAIGGWRLIVLADQTVGVLHSSGFYVAGFDSKVEAGIWLQSYLLRILAQDRREAMRQLRLLATMAPHGSVS